MQSLFSITTTTTDGQDSQEGEIRTIVERALDYETQEEVFIQIEATDSLEGAVNTAIAQLTIKVIDVNDETPVITVVRCAKLKLILIDLMIFSPNAIVFIN